MDVIKTQQISAMTIEKVVVHPLVLRSIVDRYNRVAKDSGKRVVGVLLGSSSRVPFEEDDKDPSIWFLDQNHHKSMLVMFKSINAKKDVVGWYNTCPKHRENDLDVHALFTLFYFRCCYVPNPVLVIIDVQPKELGIPTKAYYAVEEVRYMRFNASLKSSKKAFVHVSTEIAAPEVEEIGTSKRIKDTTRSTLVTEVFVFTILELCIIIHLSSSLLQLIIVLTLPLSLDEEEMR
ncbi:hypothetical protein Bca4012_018729 [Brassica carinata]|uniref:MPN domain-containing protein n=1 Tax=Brassica carinata TaxID=52824 RepID=A0A8X7WL23_BRACI|nr:hypothetical protein Bca52824_002894 [Brassica carinata]